MNASVGDTFDPERTIPGLVHAPAARGAVATGTGPVIAPCLRGAPRSPLPSDFERAVMDTAAHARYTGHCESVLRSRCRWVAGTAVALLALAAATAIYLPNPWIGTIPGILGLAAAWRWAVYSAAADELGTEAPR